MTIEEQVLKFLRDAKKVVIMGIGNVLRGDDAAGSMVAQQIASKPLPKKVLVIDSGPTPENYLGKIIKFNPSHILIIDTVVTGDKPGSVRLVNESQIVDALSFSTHKPSIHMLIKYLRGSIGEVKFLILGIQPKNLAFGEELSEEVKNAVFRVSSFLLKVLSTLEGDNDLED